MDPQRRVLQIGLSLILGASIWALSPAVTGQIEPFDHAAYFWIAMLAAGAAGASIYPRRFWIAPVAIYVGQYAYALAFLPHLRPWILFGLIIGVFFQVPSLLGALLPYVLWRLTRTPAQTD